jgi:hypothetical protein
MIIFFNHGGKAEVAQRLHRGVLRVTSVLPIPTSMVKKNLHYVIFHFAGSIVV